MTPRCVWLVLMLANLLLTAAPTHAEMERIDDPILYTRSLALVIGNGRYTQGWSPLPGVRDDVEAVSRALRDHGFEVTPAFDLAGDALRERIRSFVADAGSDSDNRVLIYYAGHGETLTLPEGQTGFLVPVDAPSSAQNPDAFRKHALGMNEVQEWSKSIQAKHVLFIFDSCFSGAVFQTMRGGAGRPSVIGVNTQNPVRQFIASGTADQTVPDQSVFRRHLVAGLAGAADLDRDGWITGTELGFYLRVRVANDSRGQQTPQFGTAMRDGFDNRGDFVLQSPIGPVAAAEPASTRSSPVSQPGREAGREFADCPDCPRMVLLPPGRFDMGSALGEEDRNGDESPQHAVTLPYVLAIGKFEVTFAEWDACFSQGGCDRWIDDGGLGRGRTPVFGVSWQDAEKYVQWLSGRTGEKYRLPTEQEWEYAARSGSATARPWGDTLGVGHANCRGCGSRWDDDRPAPVGSFDANAFGLHDMLGNVWEWVADCYAPAYDTPQNGPTACTGRVLRGGGYATDPKSVRSAARAVYPADRSDLTMGFRVARHLD